MKSARRTVQAEARLAAIVSRTSIACAW
uniref:Uncharacterized protein n=1 Tax=Arundo donax TaxID=35708 RepID=A0A0A9GVI8_ARUDO